MNVIILAAGAGVRMQGLDFPKPLVLVDGVPLIIHVMRSAPQPSKFFIAISSASDLLRDFLISQNEFDIEIIDVGLPSDTGAGPGTSLRKCLEHIKGPALFTVSDGVYTLPTSLPTTNWLAVSSAPSTSEYCGLKEINGAVLTSEKNQPRDTTFQTWIGVGFIYDWENFIKGLSSTQILGENQCSSGWINSKDKWQIINVEWIDVGTKEKYADIISTRFDYRKPNAMTVPGGTRVVKVFPTIAEASSFKTRASIMGEFGPTGIGQNGRVVFYDFIKGRIFYDVATPELFKTLLDALYGFWFRDTPPCSVNLSNFYKQKTEGRAISHAGKIEFDIDWSIFSDGIKVNCHGDLQFDNIVIDGAGNFRLIDWRTDFGESTEGDLYYDLAKLLSGILLNISKAKRDGTQISAIENHEEYIQIFKQFHIKKNLNWMKTCVLVRSCYISMAGIHTEPFASTVYKLGLADYLI